MMAMLLIVLWWRRCRVAVPLPRHSTASAADTAAHELKWRLLPGIIAIAIFIAAD